MLNHLVNTAYYVKQQTTSEKSFEAFRAFFNNYFTIFEGKHTDWLLLNEPEISEVTPEALNKRFEEFASIVNAYFTEQSNKKSNFRDYNKMVEQLNEEAQREALQNQLAKAKKQAEAQRRAEIREGKRK